MPQLNPEFFVTQLFWLVVTFSFLLVFLWRISLPRIGNVLEKRERKINENINADKQLQVYE
jgi:F-type H+-transporting ATPase subunit b